MNRSTLLALALVGIVGFGIWWAVVQPRAPPSGSLEPSAIEPVTVAWSPYELGALFWIAEERAFFGRNGLNVTPRRYETGAASLGGVLDGEADIAVGVAEFPLVARLFQDTGCRVLATIDKSDLVYLVARRDRIADLPGLRGARIGTIRGTAAEFYLGRFLALHGMTLADITLVDLTTPDEWVNATAAGDVDAIAIGQPYANAARDRLGENAVVWPIQSEQALFALAVTTDGWIEQHPGPARRFLASLAEAETYLTGNPAGSRAIVERRLNFDEGYMETVWQRNRFSLSLDQSLVSAMEDEGRWMIANNMTNATAIPDYRAYIDPVPLSEVRPDAVRLIG